MNDQIRKLVESEVARQLAQQSVNQMSVGGSDAMYQAGVPNILYHTHDNINSPKINQENVVVSTKVMGKITFASNGTYTLNFSSLNPSRIDLNGFVFDTGASDSSVMVVGTAILSKAYYFQPLTSRSVRESGSSYPISGVLAQCSSNLYIQDGVSPSNTFPHTDQFYIVNAFSSSGNHLATAQVRDLTTTSVNIVITNLAVGWNISANIIIT